MSTRVKKLTTLAMFCAIAYIVMVFFRFPILPAVSFLKYDPKDVIIAIGGFLYGPFASFAISVVVSLLEMLTVSETGPFGFVMNVLSSCAFACTAAFIYKKRPNLSGAVIGLVSGCLCATGVMLLWNYMFTPLYYGMPRQVVVEMMLPGFLPFNLLKSGINATLTMLLYKPLVTVLRKTNMVSSSNRGGVAEKGSKTATIGVVLVSLLILGSCIAFVLVQQKIL